MDTEEKWFLGLDISLDAAGNIEADSTGDLAIVEAEDCLAANLADRLFTSPGSVLLHPEFGGGIQEYVGNRMSAQEIQDLKVHVKHEVLKEPRVAKVLSVDVIEPETDSGIDARTYELRVSVETVSGQVVGNLVFPFEHTESGEGGE